MNTKNLKLYKKAFLLTMIMLKSLHEQMFFTNFAEPENQRILRTDKIIT